MWKIKKMDCVTERKIKIVQFIRTTLNSYIWKSGLKVLYCRSEVHRSYVNAA